MNGSSSTSGALVCWGTREWDGEVSGPNADARTNYVQVMAAASQTCGLRDDGTISCWGEDSYGAVSGANADPSAGFVQIGGSIEVDGNHLCGLRASGTVTCWGADTHRQLSGLQDLALRER